MLQEGVEKCHAIERIENNSAKNVKWRLISRRHLGVYGNCVHQGGVFCILNDNTWHTDLGFAQESAHAIFIATRSDQDTLPITLTLAHKCVSRDYPEIGIGV